MLPSRNSPSPTSLPELLLPLPYSPSFLIFSPTSLISTYFPYFPSPNSPSLPILPLPSFFKHPLRSSYLPYYHHLSYHFPFYIYFLLISPNPSRHLPSVPIVTSYSSLISLIPLPSLPQIPNLSFPLTSVTLPSFPLLLLLSIRSLTLLHLPLYP